MLDIFEGLAKETIASQQLRKLIRLHEVEVVVTVVVVVYYTYPQIIDILHYATMHLQLLQ